MARVAEEARATLMKSRFEKFTKYMCKIQIPLEEPPDDDSEGSDEDHPDEGEIVWQLARSCHARTAQSLPVKSGN